MQVVLVGGFASNPYLQQRVRTAAHASGLAEYVVVPPQPHAAVLIGAVGHDFKWAVHMHGDEHDS